MEGEEEREVRVGKRESGGRMEGEEEREGGLRERKRERGERRMGLLTE